MTVADLALLREGAACLALILAAYAAAFAYILLALRCGDRLHRLAGRISAYLCWFAAYLRESVGELRVILRTLYRRNRRRRCMGEKIRRTDVGYIEVLPCLDQRADRLRVRAHYVGR